MLQSPRRAELLRSIRRDVPNASVISTSRNVLRFVRSTTPASSTPHGRAARRRPKWESPMNVTCGSGAEKLTSWLLRLAGTQIPNFVRHHRRRSLRIVRRYRRCAGKPSLASKSPSAMAEHYFSMPNAACCAAVSPWIWPTLLPVIDLPFPDPGIPSGNRTDRPLEKESCR